MTLKNPRGQPSSDRRYSRFATGSLGNMRKGLPSLAALLLLACGSPAASTVGDASSGTIIKLDREVAHWQDASAAEQAAEIERRRVVRVNEGARVRAAAAAWEKAADAPVIVTIDPAQCTPSVTHSRGVGQATLRVSGIIDGRCRFELSTEKEMGTTQHTCALEVSAAPLVVELRSGRLRSALPASVCTLQQGHME